MQFRIQRRPIQLQETKDGDAQVTEVKTKLIENKKKGYAKTAYPRYCFRMYFSKCKLQAFNYSAALLSLKVETRLNSTCLKSLSVAPIPLVVKRPAAILYFFTNTFLTASARFSESF